MSTSALSSMIQAVQTKVDKSRSGGDVAEQVKMVFAEAMEAIHEGAPVPDYFKNIPQVFAGQMAEAQLLQCTDLIIDQLQADGRRALPAEVRLNIIVAIRDVKIQALEQDGNVNPLDKMTIQHLAGGLKPKVRSYLLSVRMAFRGEKELNVSEVLDMVETRLMEEATAKFGRNYDAWMREAQAAVWAVAELRQQQLAGR